MMLRAVFLYGSKARNDDDGASDTDLMGVSEDGQIQKTLYGPRISFHCYPLDWLLRNSADGSLFVLHIVKEAAALYDPEDCLGKLKMEFKYKSDYKKEIEVGLRILRVVESLDFAGFSPRVRTRYFWGLRTAIMAAAATERRPSFSSKALEKFVGIDGLAAHVKSRRDASLADCQNIASGIIEVLSPYAPGVMTSDFEENLQFLRKLGGVGAVTSGEVLYGL
jgi:hypothetical protein